MSDQLPARARVAYLDHAATTPMRPEAVAAMLPLLTERFGNPSGTHEEARSARRALDDAREQLAAEVGASASDLVFTSGGTESDNLAIAGIAGAAGAAGGQGCGVVCSAVEHPAVLEACRAAGGIVVGVDRDGLVDLDELAGLLDERVRLVSVMLVNNETGVIQPLAAICDLVAELAPRALVHTDAVQAFSWLDVAAQTRCASLVSLSAHKIGGPKGTGALVARSGAMSRLRPILRGGPQEHERRAGTQNVAGAAAMAAAATAAARDRAQSVARVTRLAARLCDEVIRASNGISEAVPRGARIPAICNLGFDGVEAEELLFVLDGLGVAASAGSACASGAVEPSHVLLAMGLDRAAARCHVRFSLGHTTTDAEVEAAVEQVAKAVAQLRS